MLLLLQQQLLVLFHLHPKGSEEQSVWSHFPLRDTTAEQQGVSEATRCASSGGTLVKPDFSCTMLKK